MKFIFQFDSGGLKGANAPGENFKYLRFEWNYNYIADVYWKSASQFRTLYGCWLLTSDENADSHISSN